MTIPPVFYIILSSLVFALMYGSVKALHGIPTTEIAFYRSLLNVVIYFPLVLNRPIIVEGRRLGLLEAFKIDTMPLLVRGISGSLSMMLYFYTISQLHLADAIMLNYFSPIPVLILSVLFLKETLNPIQILCIIISLLGIGLIIKPGFQIFNLAGFAGLAGSFIAAIAYLSLRSAAKSYPSSYIVFTFAVISTILSAGPLFFHYVAPSLKEWGLLIICGFFGALAQGLMTIGYKGLTASVATPLLLFTVLFSGIFGWIFWKEIPDFWSISGIFITAFSLIGAYRFSH